MEILIQIQSCIYRCCCENILLQIFPSQGVLNL